MKKVGFIGLGTMGMPMATNILKKGYPLYIYDIRPDLSETDIVKDGAIICESPKHVSEKTDVTILMLPNSQLVEEVVLGEEGVFEGLKEGHTLIDMSTILPEVTRKIANKVESIGANMIDAPVGKTSNHAVTGTLTIMAGGNQDKIDDVREILETMGNPEEIFYCGSVGNGGTMKLVNNLLASLIVAANAEALILGRQAGLDLETMLPVLLSTGVKNGHLEHTFPAKAFRNDFSPGFMIELAHKDLKLAMDLAEGYNYPLFLGGMTNDLYSMAKQQGKKNDDFTGLITVFEEIAGKQARYDRKVVGGKKS